MIRRTYLLYLMNSQGFILWTRTKLIKYRHYYYDQESNDIFDIIERFMDLEQLFFDPSRGMFARFDINDIELRTLFLLDLFDVRHRIQMQPFNDLSEVQLVLDYIENVIDYHRLDGNRKIVRKLTRLHLKICNYANWLDGND